MDSMYMKYENQTRATGSCCAEFTKLIAESSDSEQHHRQNKKTSGSQEAGGENRETRRNESTRREDGRIPQYFRT